MKSNEGDCSTHIFEEDLENTTGLFVDETGNTLHTTTASEATNSGFCDTLDVVAKDFAMTLSTTLAKALPRKVIISYPWFETKNNFKSPFHLYRGQTCSISLREVLKGEKQLLRLSGEVGE